MRDEKEAGTTLVEAVVTMTLTVLLVALAGSLLTFGLALSGRLQASARSAVVMDILMNRIANTLENAEIPISKTGEGYVQMEQYQDSQWIAVTDQQGKAVSMFAMEDGVMGGGQLFLQRLDDGEEPVPVFEDAVYQGFAIERLTFTRVDTQEDLQVIEIRLLLVQARSGKLYEEFRYVRIPNGTL